MNTKLLTIVFGIVGLGMGVEKLPTPESLRSWILKMHREQIELLKINWGNPGFSEGFEKRYRRRGE